MNTRIKQLISTLVNGGKINDEEENNLQKSLENVYKTNKTSYMNVGERYKDMTVYATVGNESDRIYIVKKDSDNKWYVMNAFREIINNYE